MEEERNNEHWDANAYWDHWMGTVENRFTEVYAQGDRFEAALFGAAGIEPVVLASVNTRIEVALKQYNENMRVEFENMQGHFTRMKSSSDQETQSMFGQAKERFVQEMDLVVKKDAAECKKTAKKLDEYVLIQEKLFETKLQASVQKMQTDLLNTVEKNAEGVVGQITKVLDRVQDVGKIKRTWLAVCADSSML